VVTRISAPAHAPGGSRCGRAHVSAAIRDRRLGASAAGQRPQRVAVGIDDLAGTGRRPRHHQLVAGRQHRDLGTTADRQVRMVHRGRERERAVGEAAAGREQHIAFAKIDACGADMPSRDGGLGDVMWPPSARVSSWMITASAPAGSPAGKNPHRFARADRPLERPTGCDFAGHLQPGREIRRIGRTDA